MSKRIVVVDDQEYLRDVQVMLLTEAGYCATGVATASEALERLPEMRPDLILLDMSMPGMDGRQFLRRLRASERWASVPVIIATGFATDEVQPGAHAPVDVLAKPFSDAALLERVRRLIGNA